MTNDNTTTDTAATYTHETMSREDFRGYIARLFGRRGERGKTISGNYRYVEYFNAPQGLIVFAHRASEQVDGIHPASLSESIEDTRNIVEPLRRSSDSQLYNIHYMTRRSQGGMILEAFGRMIDGGDPEAPSIESSFRTMEIFDTPKGIIIGCIADADNVYVIKPAEEIVIEFIVKVDGKMYAGLSPEKFAQLSLPSAESPLCHTRRHHASVAARFRKVNQDLIKLLEPTPAQLGIAKR